MMRLRWVGLRKAFVEEERRWRVGVESGMKRVKERGNGDGV